MQQCSFVMNRSRKKPKSALQELTRSLLRQNAIRAKAKAITNNFACPFCGAFELFVHAPGTQHWSGPRTWWTIGCESRVCDSRWRMDVDTYAEAISKLSHAQKI